MAELNRPMYSDGGMSPVGYAFAAAYAAYFVWNIVAPPTEAEQKAEAERASERAAMGQTSATFMEAAAAEEGALTTDTGLVFFELASGAGDTPLPGQKVKVHYEGKLPDGTVFDSSLSRGEPAEFKLDQVIPGWQEGLQLMRPGGKARLTIPSQLAYGDFGSGSIPGNAALQFEVELMEVSDAGFSLPFL